MLKKRIIGATAWTLLGVLLSKVGTLVVSVLMARILTVEDFGGYGVIQSTAALVGVFAGFNLGAVASKYVSELREAQPEKAGGVIALATISSAILGFATSIIIIFLAKPISVTLLKAPWLQTELQIAGIIVFLMSIIGVQSGILAAFEEFRVIAKLGLFGSLASMPSMLVGAWKFGLEGALVGQVISLLLLYLYGAKHISTILVRNGISVNYHRMRESAGVIKKYGVPAVLSAAIVGPVAWIGNAILVNTPNGYAEMGVYNAANQWRNLMLVAPAALGAMILPILSKLKSDGDQENFIAALYYQLIFVGAQGIIICLLILVYSEEIMSSYGEQYIGGNMVLNVLAISAAIIGINNQLSRAVASIDKMWISFSFDVVWSLTFISSCLLLIKQYQGIGLASSALIASFAQLIWQGVVVYKLGMFSRGVEKQHLTNLQR